MSNEQDEQQDLYDEFGNYIGPELDSSSSSSSSDDESSTSSEESSTAAGGAPAARAVVGDAVPDDAASDVSDDNNMMIVSEQDGPPPEASGTAASAIVLHEDKVHYPSAQEIYGEGVKTAVLDEDAMDLDVPIVEPVKTKTFSLVKDLQTSQEEGVGIPSSEAVAPHDVEEIVSDKYITTLLSNETTRTRRGIALIGHLHCGKTSFVDVLVEQTKVKMDAFGPRASLEAYNKNGGTPRITDSLHAEQDRQLSIKSTPITLCLPDTRGKSYLCTIMDCPGHANFHDETVASLKVADGAVLVLDAVEGIMIHTEMALHAAVMEGLPITLLINKIDRLILELKLPPNDWYYKVRHLIDSVNELIAEYSNGRYSSAATARTTMNNNHVNNDYLSPEKGNVAFASSLHGYSFTLESFAQLYVDHCWDDEYGLGNNLTMEELTKRLWGDCYLDPASKTFKKHARDCSVVSDGTVVKRTFVTFVLEPIYKIYTACLGESEGEVAKLLRSVGVLLSKEQLRASARPLMRAAFRRFFGNNTGFVDMIVRHVPSPAAAARGKIARCYTGPLDSPVAKSMIKCDARGPLMIHCTKLYASPDGQSFSAFGRIYSGTVKPGDQVKVLGEAYSPDDDEDMALATVSAVSIPRGRRKTDVTMAKAGNWILLDGVDANISKTATITSADSGGGGGMMMEDEFGDRDHDVHIFAPLKFPEAGGEAVMKLAVEPLNPAELPKMVEGLRRISKSYPMARTRVEESGEHVLFGTGELYLDCVMYDLRHVYSDIEVKVADPVVAFRETVIETSSLKCFAETANKRNKLTVIAEPLDDGLAEKLEAGKVNLNWDNKKVGRFFQTQYDWDLLSSRSVWAFGPSPTHGTNILMDDTLPSEVDKALLNSCKSSIVQGFQWAMREGPLCEEPVRSTKIKILDAVLAEKPIHRGGGQIIPTARRTVHSALLTATPRLMEPVYRLQIQCPGEIVEAFQPVLTKRRGHVVQETPIPGSPLYSVKAFIPVIDSFGFETDIRTFTQGQAMVHSVFDHWAVVRGDPLDRSIILHPLEPSPPQHLAREFLVKTRRRKGLSEDVSLSKFFDEGMKAQLAQDVM